MFCNCEIKKGSFQLDNGIVCCCVCEKEIKHVSISKEIYKKIYNEIPLPDACSWCSKCEKSCIKKHNATKNIALITVEYLYNNCKDKIWLDVKSEIEKK